MSQELLRIVDGLARDKNIDRTTVLEDLEAAILSAIRKGNAAAEDVVVRIDPDDGNIFASVDGKEMAMRDLGRIAAQTAKQVMIQRIREAERGSIYDEYVERRGEIITGRASRWEGGALVIELGRIEAYLPKGEQIPGESHEIGERIRAMVLDVREQPNAVKVVLSRTHPDFIRAMFDLEVPEVAEDIIEIKAMAREAGYRTKVAVNSLDPKVDAVGACVGIRGSRIKNIVDELGGEKIDIVRWNDSSKILIANSLKPAEIAEVALCFELGRATVVVVEEQLSLAIGKRGQNVRLAARLTGWDIDILTPTEFNTSLDTLEKALREIEGVQSTMVDQIIAMGMVSVVDMEEVGTGPLVKELGLDEAFAAMVVAKAVEAGRRLAAEAAAAKKQTQADAETKKQDEAAAAAAPQEPAGEADPADEAPSEADIAPESDPDQDAQADGEAPAEAEAPTEPAAPTETNGDEAEAPSSQENEPQ